VGIPGFKASTTAAGLESAMSLSKTLLLGLAVAVTCLAILFQFYVFYLLIDMRIHLPGWGGFAAWMVIVTGLTYLVAPATVLSLALAIWFIWIGALLPLLTWAAITLPPPG
jgi:hypothetical protein